MNRHLDRTFGHTKLPANFGIGNFSSLSAQTGFEPIKDSHLACFRKFFLELVEDLLEQRQSPLPFESLLGRYLIGSGGQVSVLSFFSIQRNDLESTASF